MIKLTKRKNAKNEEIIILNPPIGESNEETNNKLLSNNNSMLSSSNYIYPNDEMKVSCEVINQTTQANDVMAIDNISKADKIVANNTSSEGQQQNIKRRIVPTIIK